MRLLLILIFLYGLFACSSKPQDELYRFSGLTMGSTYQVKWVGPPLSEAEINRIQLSVDKVLSNINKQMSTYDPTSEISRFNQLPAGVAMTISAEFGQVLSAASKLSRESDNYFDPTIAPLVDLWGFGAGGTRGLVPDPNKIEAVKQLIGLDKLEFLNDSTLQKKYAAVQLDLNAIVAGYAADQIGLVLEKMAIKNYLVEITGEIRVRGINLDKPWQIGIDRPDLDNAPGENLQAILQLKDISVATSGDYRNYYRVNDSTYTHIIDPKLGRPIVNGVASVTVLAPDCATADGMATAIMVMGREKGMAWAAQKPGIEVMVITRTDQGLSIYESAGFARYIVAGEEQ